MDFNSSESFDAYVIYLYTVLGHPAKEIAEHQGVSKDDVSEILRKYGFNFKNTYGAGQHFKAYPKGKSFRLKNGKTISLEITQDFVESYVKSGNFYDNSFEDYINRFFAPEPEPKKEKPVREEREPKALAPPKQRRAVPLSPKLITVLKILACIVGAGLLVLIANCAGCISFEDFTCAGYSPIFEGKGEADMFDLNFSAMDAESFGSEVAVLIDGEERGKLDFTASESLLLQVEKTSEIHILEIEVNGERSNPIMLDMSASKMYIVASMESDKPHIAQTTEE
ncbi:MAG: hypothetical protein ACI4QY_05405 [Oscillospiraceae bacterium]